MALVAISLLTVNFIQAQSTTEDPGDQDNKKNTKWNENTKPDEDPCFWKDGTSTCAYC